MWEDPSDKAELVQRALQGEEAAWTRLYGLYHREMNVVLRRKSHFALRNGEDCVVETIGDTFLKLKRYALAKYDPARSLLAFVLHLVRNEASTHIPACIGKEHPGEDDPGKIPDPFSLADWQEARDELLRLLAWLERRLNDTDRLIFTWFYLDGLKALDIARRLSWKQRQVFTRIEHIRELTVQWRKRGE